jgi:5-oxoprolinase (ATP-hydrolysing)
MDRERLTACFTAGVHPSRDPRANVADVEAQIAANRTGARLLLELVAQAGAPFLLAYMGHLRTAAAGKVRQLLATFGQRSVRFEDALDDGSPVCVELTVRDQCARFDFSGTASEHPGNLNAPRAVTVAAVLYALRTAIGSALPLNSGCLEPIELSIPARSLLDPSPGAAVAAGNVETSQRVVDVVLAALGKLAACQGTMNNLTFGDDQFGYYETICGGAGAGPGFAGATAVQTHMTNTRITDVEVLETRYPVRVLQFGIRRASGGSGKYAGGDGVVREIEFLRPLRVALISERRTRAPFGLAGGAAGALGRNTFNDEPVAAKFERSVQPGDRLRIETPGGGGYGAG